MELTKLHEQYYQKIELKKLQISKIKYRKALKTLVLKLEKSYKNDDKKQSDSLLDYGIILNQDSLQRTLNK